MLTPKLSCLVVRPSPPLSFVSFRLERCFSLRAPEKSSVDLGDLRT